jgi:probable F420-dependent oxidoreductase
VELGVVIFATEEPVAPAELGRLVEDAGFDSLWLPEHTHIPVSRETPYPGGGELAPEFSRTLDPFVLHGALAAATERLLLGFAVCLLIQRDPIVTAKELATLELISGGRVLFGVGAGWNHEEMRDHGTDPARRFLLLRERVEAMQAIWTEERAAYHGELVDFDELWAWPKPAAGRPPVYVGGNGPRVLDRVLRYGDGWLPSARREQGVLTERIAELRRRGIESGRGPLPTTVFGAPPEREVLEAYERAGAERAVLWLPSGPRERIERRLERYAILR